MAEYIGCRNCDSPDCHGCNVYTLSRMLNSGKFDGLMNGNRSINPFATDVVEVSCRCKDCKHWMDFPNCGCTDFVKVCALAGYMIGANGYCLYGERMDGDKDG